MPNPNRQLPTVQLDLFLSPSPQGLNWLGLSAEVREKMMNVDHLTEPRMPRIKQLPTFGHMGFAMLSRNVCANPRSDT